MNETETVTAKVLRVEEGLYLVEWREPDGMLERYWVKGEMILSMEGNHAQVEDPKRGVPYADSILADYSLQISFRDLERELRNRKIWTFADVIANPNGVAIALQAALGVDLASLRNTALQNTRR